MSGINETTNDINNDQMRIAITGHRCLQPYSIEDYLKEVADEYPGAVWATNGSLGAGLHASAFAMKHGITLDLVLPFPPAVLTGWTAQAIAAGATKDGKRKVSRKWSEDHRRLLDAAVKYCRWLSVLAPIYSVLGYQRANQRLVDISTGLVAMMDPAHTHGRTVETVWYAEKTGAPFTIIDIRDSIDKFGTGEFLRYGKHKGKVVRIMGAR